MGVIWAIPPFHDAAESASSQNLAAIASISTTTASSSQATVAVAVAVVVVAIFAVPALSIPRVIQCAYLEHVISIKDLSAEDATLLLLSLKSFNSLDPFPDNDTGSGGTDPSHVVTPAGKLGP